MKGLPRATLSLACCPAWQGGGNTLPPKAQDGASDYWGWLPGSGGFSALRSSCPRAGSPGLQRLGRGIQGPHPGVCLPCLPGSAPRQPTTLVPCGFRISCRCHPERPADRQGSHRFQKAALSSARANYTCREEERPWASPSLFPVPAPKPLPQEPFSSLPSACSKGSAASAPANYGSSSDKYGLSPGREDH